MSLLSIGTALKTCANRCNKDLGNVPPEDLTNLLVALNQTIQYLGSHNDEESYAEVKENHAGLIQAIYGICVHTLPAMYSSFRSNGKLVRSLNILSKLDSLLWVATLKLYRILVSWNPTAALSTWSLFLVDTNNVDKAIGQLASQISSSSLDSTEKLNLGPVLSQIPITSPIISAALLSTDVDIRTEAIKCMHALVYRLPLQQWFSTRTVTNDGVAKMKSSSSAITRPSAAPPVLLLRSENAPQITEPNAPAAMSSVRPQRKPIARKSSQLGMRGLGLGEKIACTILKIMHVVTLLLLQTQSNTTDVLKELLSACSAIFAELPLRPVGYTPLDGISQGRAGNDINLKGGSDCSLPDVEDSSHSLFYAILQVCCGLVNFPTAPSVPIPDMSTDVAHIPSHDIMSVQLLAFNWISEFSKSNRATSAFQSAANQGHFAGAELNVQSKFSAPAIAKSPARQPQQKRTQVSATETKPRNRWTSSVDVDHKAEEKGAKQLVESDRSETGSQSYNWRNQRKSHAPEGDLQFPFAKSEMCSSTNVGWKSKVLFTDSKSSSTPVSQQSELSNVSISVHKDQLPVIKRNFIQIISDWALLPGEEKAVRTSLNSIPSICRILLLQLVSLYPGMFVVDIQWLNSYIFKCVRHNDEFFREYGIRILVEMIKMSRPNQILPLQSVIDTGESNNLAPSVALTLLLLLSVSDSDHKVRSLGLVGIGQLNSSDWQILSRLKILELVSMVQVNHSTDLDALLKGFSYQSSDATVVDCANLLLCALLSRARDTLGLVRTSAGRALGEAVGHGALTALAEAQGCKYARLAKLSFVEIVSNSSTANSNDTRLTVSPELGPDSEFVWADHALARIIAHCCEDSKLSVRLQGSYSFGCLLLHLLPFRGEYLNTLLNSSVSSSNSDEYMIGLVDDESWLRFCRDTISLLSDSDKILASATRCLGLLSAGLIPIIPAHFSVLLDIVSALLQRFKIDRQNSVTSSSQDASSTTLNPEEAEKSRDARSNILDQPKKIIFSLAQALGLVSRVFIKHILNGGDKESVTCSSHLAFNTSEQVGDARQKANDCLDQVKHTLISMLRFGVAVKIRLQSCKGLVYLFFLESVAARTTVIDIEQSISTIDSSIHSWNSSYFQAIECVLTISTGTVQQGISGASSSRENDPVPQALQRSLLVLFWVLLKNALNVVSRIQGRFDGNDATSHLNGKFVDDLTKILLHYIEQIVDWLEIISSYDKKIVDSELSISSMPLVGTTLIGLLPPQGMSCADMVADVSQMLILAMECSATLLQSRDLGDTCSDNDSLFWYGYDRGFGVGGNPATSDSVQTLPEGKVLASATETRELAFSPPGSRRQRYMQSMLTSAALSTLQRLSRRVLQSSWGFGLGDGIGGDALEGKRLGLQPSMESLLWSEPTGDLGRNTRDLHSRIIDDIDDEDEI